MSANKLAISVIGISFFRLTILNNNWSILCTRFFYFKCLIKNIIFILTNELKLWEMRPSNWLRVIRFQFIVEIHQTSYHLSFSRIFISFFPSVGDDFLFELYRMYVAIFIKNYNLSQTFRSKKKLHRDIYKTALAYSPLLYQISTQIPAYESSISHQFLNWFR